MATVAELISEIRKLDRRQRTEMSYELRAEKLER